ncbi:MAG: hypothetical protein FJ202_08260 [Gemmatimonadetes bacterium]|nr:hypothetical protein [Gemmatimonadota bacterium]
MSAAVAARPFVTALRTPRGVVHRIGAAGGDRVTVRVQFEALWDAIAVETSSDTPVAALVDALLGSIGMAGYDQAHLVVKLRGWEVRGTESTVASAGARDGSTFHVAYRHRRPVR